MRLAFGFPLTVWVTVAAVAVVATLVLVLVVPRLPAPVLMHDDDPLPDYPALATPGSAALLFAAAFGVAQVLWLVPPSAWPLWVPYLALGAPLVFVDLRTTYLPLRLHRLALGAMLLGLLPLALGRPGLVLAACLGAVASGALFWLVWRFSRSFGFGDVRLAVLVGAVSATGAPGSPAGSVSLWLSSLLLGTFLGAVAGVAWAVIRRRRGGPGYFAYGPWLWLGPVAAVTLSGW